MGTTMLRLIIPDPMFNLPDLTESNNCQQVIIYVLSIFFLFLFLLFLFLRLQSYKKIFNLEKQLPNISQTAIYYTNKEVSYAKLMH